MRAGVRSHTDADDARHALLLRPFGNVIARVGYFRLGKAAAQRTRYHRRPGHHAAISIDFGGRGTPNHVGAMGRGGVVAGQRRNLLIATINPAGQRGALGNRLLSPTGGFGQIRFYDISVIVAIGVECHMVELDAAVNHANQHALARVTGRLRILGAVPHLHGMGEIFSDVGARFGKLRHFHVLDALASGKPLEGIDGD